MIDGGFGSGGTVNVSGLATGTSTIEQARDVRIDAAGRILVAGALFNATNSDIAVARLLPDGTPDPAFGTNGVARADLFGEVGQALALQADGKIVVGGYGSVVIGSSSYSAIFLARFTDAGVLDTDPVTGFGPLQGGTRAGIFFDYLPGLTLASNDLVRRGGIVVQPDGKILVAGGPMTTLPGYPVPPWVLARYLPDGSSDPAFGWNGKVYGAFAGFTSTQFRVWGVAIAGSLIYASGRVTSGGSFDIAVARYTESGILDTSWGSGGLALSGLGGEDQGFQCAVLADGGVAVTGNRVNGSNVDISVFSFTASGTPDLAFGSNGLADLGTIPGRTQAGEDVAVDAHGRLVVVGMTSLSGSPSLVAVERVYGFLPAGVTGFGNFTPGCTGPVGIGVSSTPQAGNLAFAVTGAGASPGAAGFLGIGAAALQAPALVAGIELWVDISGGAIVPVTADAVGRVLVPLGIPAGPGVSGFQAFAQFAWLDACAPGGASASNALAVVIQP